MLHLNAALAAATLRDAGTAMTHLDEAAELAAHLPEQRENFGFLHFGPANVGECRWRPNSARAAR
jgi:hypothetical protein